MKFSNILVGFVRVEVSGRYILQFKGSEQESKAGGLGNVALLQRPGESAANRQLGAGWGSIEASENW